MLQDFLSFERYLTPSIIRVFYILQLVLIAIFFLSGLVGALAIMGTTVIGGLLYLVAIAVGAVVGVIAARIVTELVMVLFQNNEHLAAIRAHAEGGASTV